MARKPKKSLLLLIAAGGTISMVRDPQTGQSIPRHTAADLLARTSLAKTLEVRVLDLAPKASSLASPEDLLTLAHCIQQAMHDEVRGIVVTHGTDAMEEVAFFIDEVVSAAVPIVFTGAMRPSWATGYDGIRNLENALRVAAGVPAAYGTLVTMNDEIFVAWSVSKTDTGALDAFTARRGAPVGRIFGDQVEFTWQPLRPARFASIPPSLPPSVPIVTLGVADDAVLLDRSLPLPMQGVVIAGMAAGSVPQLARRRVLTLAASGLPVVLCSSAASGRTAEEYYYPGAYDDFTRAGVLIEDWLTPRKARIRLMISLGLHVPYVPFGREFALTGKTVE